MVVGTQKGGTTAAAEFLAQHPQVCFSQPKELHFFSDDGFYPDFDRYHRHFGDAAGRRAVGEATPLYMFLASALQRIHDYNPGMRLVYLLRNPIERAYSHFQMNVRLGLERLPFGECIRTEPLRIMAAHDGDAASSMVNHSYVSRGLYYEQLKFAFGLFPREQLLILRSEDLEHRHDETVRRIFGFLGLDESVRVPAKRVHAQSYDTPMSAADRDFLVRRFAPDMAKVEQLLDWDLSGWR